MLQLTWVDYCSYFGSSKALTVFCEIILAKKCVLFGGLMCRSVDAWLMIPPILCGRRSLSPPLCAHCPPLPLFVMLDTDMINLRKCHWPTHCERRCSSSGGNTRESATEERVGKKERGKTENERDWRRDCAGVALSLPERISPETELTTALQLEDLPNYTHRGQWKAPRARARMCVCGLQFLFVCAVVFWSATGVCSVYWVDKGERASVASDKLR